MEGTKESEISVFLVVLFYVLTNVTTVDYAPTFAKAILHASYNTLSLILGWRLPPSPRGRGRPLRTDYEFIISPPEIPKPAFVRNLLCVYKRTCISIYKYPFHFISFPYLQSTRDARFNAEATWTGRAHGGGCPVLATPRISSADPGGSVSEFEKICGIIFNERLGLGFHPSRGRPRLGLPRGPTAGSSSLAIL